MPERTVKVNLVAQVNGYINGMEQASRATRDLGTDAQRLAAKRQDFDQLGRSMLMFGAIAAAAVGIAIKKFADFDKAMSQVNAVTQESTANLDLLRNAALEAGGATVFTATEAANAIEELGKAGLSTADILGGALSGALSLAASGQLEVARAAEITATTLKQFGLAGDQAGHVADVLSAGAGKALGSVEDLAQGLKFVGPVAASMGVSLEETTGALALFADQGIIGEQAGTSLRGVLSSLTSPSAEASKEIARLGINLYDLQTNKFLGVEHAAGQLDKAFTGLDDKTRDMSLGIIFGNQQVTAARVLFQGGATDVAKYTAQVNDAGYAARVAADRMDNLSGDVEKLGGAFDTALIRTGSGANDILRSIVQTVTFLVDGFGSLPEPLLGAGLGVGAVAAAMALVGGTALIAVPKIVTFKTTLQGLGVTAGSAARSIAIAGGAISVATGLFAFFATTAADARALTQEFKDTLDATTGATTKYTRAFIEKSVAESDWIGKSAKDIGVSQKEIVDAIYEGGDALDELKAKFVSQNNIVNFFNGSGIAAGNATQTIDELGDALDRSQDEFKNVPPVVKPAAEAYQDAADNAAALQSNLDQLIDTINKANGVGQDAVSTNAAYQDAIAGISEEVKRQQDAYEEASGSLDGFSFSIDESTAAGSKNAEMFADLAKKSQDAAQAQFDLDGNTENYIANLNSGRQALYDQIVALTGNADAAQALTDKVYAIPSEKEIKFLADTEMASRTIDDFITAMGQRVGVINFRAMQVDTNGAASGNGQMGTFGSGGYTGDGDPLDPAGVVHRKEWVSDAETTAKPANRAALEYMHAGGDMSNFGTAPVYQPASAATPSVSTSNWGGSTTKVDMNVTGADPVVGAEMVYQRLRTGLVSL